MVRNPGVSREWLWRSEAGRATEPPLRMDAMTEERKNLIRGGAAITRISKDIELFFSDFGGGCRTGVTAQFWCGLGSFFHFSETINFIEE